LQERTSHKKTSRGEPSGSKAGENKPQENVTRGTLGKEGTANTVGLFGMNSLKEGAM
jgi:hypothetical protein